MQISGELKYEDFEIEISQGKGRDYPIAVLHSEAGEARETMHFPYDELVLENRLLALKNALLGSGGIRRTSLSPEEQTVQNFGSDLFNALITGEVRNRYDISLEKAKQKGRGLRIKLRIQPPNLAVLPWEFLYEPRQAEYMGLMRSVSVVRYPEHPQPIQPLSVTLPLRILGMVVSPIDLPKLDIDIEKQRVEESIKDLQKNGLVELTWLEGQTWRDLQKAMRNGPWHIFHFIGHGGFDHVRNEGLIALADEEGRMRPFSATELSRLLADHHPLRLVILNSCEGARGSERDLNSSTASILVRRGIPAVLAMQYKITDRAAIEFARTFYETLADGLPVDAAVAEARKAISIEVANTVEWGTPVLYMRSSDGMLFDIQKAKGKKREDLSALYSKGMEAIAMHDWQTAIVQLKNLLAIDAGYGDASARLKEVEQQLELMNNMKKVLKEGEERKAREKQLEKERRDIEAREKAAKEAQLKEQEMANRLEQERLQRQREEEGRIQKETIEEKRISHKKFLVVASVLGILLLGYWMIMSGLNDSHKTTQLTPTTVGLDIARNIDTVTVVVTSINPASSAPIPEINITYSDAGTTKYSAIINAKVGDSKAIDTNYAATQQIIITATFKDASKKVLFSNEV